MTPLVLIDPPLFTSGERLSLDEFLNRWDRMPSLKFAELIDGVVHMPSPVSHKHSRRDNQMQLLLSLYAVKTAVCEVLPNATWLMLDSAPQPDVALRLLPEFGGRTDISSELASGAPELVVEVTRSTRSFDLGPKLALYQRAGVLEYVAVLVEDERVEWRVLEAGSYRLQQPDTLGIFRSSLFSGLWLDEGAFWESDSHAMLAVLQQGLDSDECLQFLERMRRR